MSDVIRGNDELLSQDFVLNTQTVAANEGFRNVSQTWYNKTMSFEEGMEHVENEARLRHDMMVSRQEIGFSLNDKEQFVVTIEDNEYRPTEHGCRQLCNWFNMSQIFAVNYLNAENEDFQKLLTEAFRTHQRNVDDKKLLFRCYDDGTLRAVLTERYATINNHWYLELLQKLVPGGRLSHFDRSDADTLYGNILIPDTIRQETDSEYGGMLSIGNCEIGTRRLFQLPSIFRAICMNGCIWGQKKGEAYSKVHRGKINLESEATHIENNLKRQIPLLNTGVDMLLETRSFKMTAGLAEIFATVIDEHKLNRKVVHTAVEMHKKYGDNMTAFGLVDAITRAGQEHDSESWFAADEFAGTIVAGGEKYWETFNARAKTMTTEKAKKLLGV